MFPDHSDKCGSAFIVFFFLLVIPLGCSSEESTSSDMPVGMSITAPHSDAKYIVSETFHSMEGWRNELSTNIIIGPYVEWHKFNGRHIYGYNDSGAGRQMRALGKNGYFVVDTHSQIIYYDVQRSLIQDLEAGHEVYVESDVISTWRPIGAEANKEEKKKL